MTKRTNKVQKYVDNERLYSGGTNNVKEMGSRNATRMNKYTMGSKRKRGREEKGKWLVKIMN